MYLPVSADGGGYTVIVPMKMRTLSPSQDVGIHKRVSLGVVLENFKVGIGQESTVGYREPRRDTQLAGLAAGREERLVRVLDV